MKNFLLIIVGILIGAGIILLLCQTQQKREIVYLPIEMAGPLKYNCELSGGTFANDACTCPIESFQTQDEMYDKATGFCQTAMGGPAGEAFAASVGLPHGSYDFWNTIVVNLCTESGGSMSSASCSCPAPKTYSETTGKCE